MIRLTILVFIAVLVSITKTTGQFHQVDTFLQHQVKQYHIPALSAAVIDNGKVIYQTDLGHENIEYKIKNCGHTAFQLASSTKLLTATALMTLVQEGKLNLHAKVNSYLRDVPNTWSDMEVMDLVAHQSGIADLLGMQYIFKNTKVALDTAMQHPLDFAPGTKTVYGGGDYAVVTKLIEKIAGVPFQQFLNERLFKKLGMDHSRFNNMEQDFIYRISDTIPYAATVYKWSESDQQQKIFSMLFPAWTYPAGGLYSSVEDLSKWAVALDNNTLLQPQVEEQMWTAAKHRDGSTAPFGVGWIVDKYKDEKVTGHSGGPALSDIVRLPGKKVTVIILTNQLELRPFLAMKVLDFYMSNR